MFYCMFYFTCDRSFTPQSWQSMEGDCQRKRHIDLTTLIRSDAVVDAVHRATEFVSRAANLDKQLMELSKMLASDRGGTLRMRRMVLQDGFFGRYKLLH